MDQHIDVIATTISGSISDWGKVKRIIPLFAEREVKDVTLHVVDSHEEARRRTCDLVKSGSRIIISAGGSGTFNRVLEGCYDSGIGFKNIRIGFLRKGSADLIGKVLQMPDEIEPAIDVFVNSIKNNRVIPCDIIQAHDNGGSSVDRRFVGYGGLEIFGEIPYFTENRFIKYYKGVLSQLFGDLGPFFVGTMLTIIRRIIRSIWTKKRYWSIRVDGKEVTNGHFQAMILVNGDLGKDLPFAKSAPLGSGEFYLFTIRNLGVFKLFKQLKYAWDASIMKNPEKWGFESFIIKEKLEAVPSDKKEFAVNIDGSTMPCKNAVEFEIIDKVNLIAK